jgi:hypothetical protein
MSEAFPTYVPGKRSLSPQLGIVLSILLLSVWAILAIWQEWNIWPQDLSAVYIAGHFLETGQTALIYQAPEGFFGGPADSWLPVIETLGGPDVVSYPFVYPPLWAALVAPITDSVDVLAFSNAISIAQYFFLAGSVLLAARLFRPATMPLYLWCVIGAMILQFSIPVYVAVGHNQPTITMVFLILLSFERLAAGRPIWAGVALAVAAALKLTPAVFVLIFLLERQYRALAAFAVAGAALGVLSLALAGIDLHFAYLDALGLVKETALLSAVNISLKPALIALGAEFGLGAALDHAEHGIVLRDLPFWLGPSLSFTAFAIIATGFVALRRWPADLARAMAILLLSIVLPLFGPLGWQHYYILPALLLPGLIARMPKAQAVIVGIPLVVLTLTFVGDFIIYLPWPLGHFVWIHCALWLVVLAIVLRRILRGPDPA